MTDRALLKTDIPYQTFHYITQAIQIGSYNAQWSLPAGAFVSGIFIAFTVKSPYLGIGGAIGAATVIPARASLNVVPEALTGGSAQYCYAFDIKDTQLQVNNITYPAALAPYGRQL